jgi:hypothetical protein
MTKLNNEICELSVDELNGVSGGQVGGISITHGGGNMNVAKGPLSEADGRGSSITNGGFNSNVAAGKFSSADQQ